MTACLMASLLDICMTPAAHLVRLHVLIEGGARTRARLAHDEALVHQRPRRHLLGARERVLDGGHQHVRMHGEGLGTRGPVLRRTSHDRQLDLAFAHQRDHFVAVVGDLQPDLDAGVLVAETGEQARQEVLGRADHGHIEHTGLQPAKARHHVFRIAHGGEYAPGVGEHVLAHHGERDLAAGAVKHRQAHLGLELLDLHRYRRSREAELLRGPHEAQVPGDSGENPQLTQRGVLH